MSTAKLKKEVLRNLESGPKSLVEIAEAMDLKEKRVFRLLRSLFEGGEIVATRDVDGARKYRLTSAEEKAAAVADEGEKVDVDEGEDDED
jgi:predicted transcriptional regulator